MVLYRKLRWQWLPLFDGDTSVVFGAAYDPRDPDESLFGVEIVKPEPGETPTAVINIVQAKRLHAWLGAKIKEIEG